MEHVEYALALAMASVPVIAAVHREADPRPYIRSAWTLSPPFNVNPHFALLIVIAAQIDPDTTLGERLSWTNQCDPGVIAACGGI